ncbi:MAG: hypothetical protein JXQ72_04060 [Anaerolineae bacterium]|nr:hypothetical protein [Anaerolineae bacterium]
MLTGSCPDCRAPIQIDRNAVFFTCPACGARFEFVEKNGRRVVRRVENWPSPAPAQRLEILLRVDRFVLLLVLLAAVPLMLPVYQLAYGGQDITLPGIGTLESRPKIEQASKTTTTTAYVTEARVMERRPAGVVATRKTTLIYEVRYQFEVNGQWYTFANDIGKNEWFSINKALWERVAGELDAGGQSTIQVKYVTADPWTNRPVNAESAQRMEWVILLFVLGFAGFFGLVMAYATICNYVKARRLAAEGITGKLTYWEVVPPK